MPPVAPNPVGDLARMYRARIPTPTQTFGGQPRMLGIENPQGNTSALGRIGSGLRSVVESLDPRAIAREGGRSVQHVVGDVGELAKSVVTGKDTLSQSPSARAYQAAGGGVGGVAAAALPYVNVGTAVVPTTRVLTPAGRAAMAADATERAGQALLSEGIATATPGARRVGSDVAERLAQQTAQLSDRPTIRPAGVYAMDDSLGNVTLYKLDDKGRSTGFLRMMRGADGFTVSEMSAEPGSVVASQLLAGAKVTADLNFPSVQYPLQPSINLSQYSRPLVEKLQAAGLVDPDYVLPPATAINELEVPFHNKQLSPYDLPQLQGIPPEDVRRVSREMIQALATAKREGRINPDTVTRAAELRNELARRKAQEQLRLQQINEVAERRLVERQARAATGAQSAADPEQLLRRAQQVFGFDDARGVMDAVNNPPNEMVQELFDYTNVDELIITPIEQLYREPGIDPIEVRGYLNDLASTIEERLVRANPDVYSRDDDRFQDIVWETIADLWYDYGGARGRAVMDSLDPQVS